MKLQALIECHGLRAAQGVPDWMQGFWKRRSISFADGTTDLRTHVCWVQSRNFTIDLRLPVEPDQLPAKRLDQYTADELRRLADYEGWCADSDWDGRALRWADTDVTLQLHNRWPEPAFLRRTGNCMIEHCPSNIYVEDWRLQPSRPGPLVGLRLIEERELGSGKLRHAGGGLIVCGDHAALALGRAVPVTPGASLQALAAAALGDSERLSALFNFEVSVASGDWASGYTVALSTQPGRAGRPIFPLDGFEFDAGRVVQKLDCEGVSIERVFEIDTLEMQMEFPQFTTQVPEAADWYAREEATLARYVECLY